MATLPEGMSMISISSENAAMLASIGNYFEGIDGTTRSVDDVVEWLIGAVSSIRPDLAKAIIAEAPISPKEDN